MSSLGSPNPFFIAGKKAYEIERSLRFNDDDTAYLSRTPSSAGNRKKWTFSAWIKRGNLGGSAGEQRIFGGNANASHIYFPSNDEITWDLANEGSGSSSGNLNTQQKFRDPSAWFHLVCALDTDNSTADNRMRMYMNGVEITDFGSRSNPTSGYSTNAMNNNTLHTLGYRTSGQGSAGMEFDGYMAEINFIDGQQYDPSYFGETDAITGQWNPKKYTGSYGTNGFYLNFSNNSGTTATTLGKDSSGNGNNFTPNNFSVSAGAGNDSLEDTPTNNFCTYNPLDSNTGIDFTNGNLVLNTSQGFDLAKSTFFLSSGKWYWEVTCDDTGSGFIGVSDQDDALNNRGGSNATSCTIRSTNGDKRINSSNSSYGSAISDGDVMIFALDMDNGKFWAGKNGTFFNSGDPAAGSNAATSALTKPVSPSVSLYDNEDYTANFGQRAFSYTPPTGYQSLCSQNLPDPTILLPNKHFDTLTWAGDGSANRSITGLEFEPDWTWIKNRSQATTHSLQDSVIGFGDDKTLRSDTTGGLATNGNLYGYINNALSNGVSLNAGSSASSSRVNSSSSGATHVGWFWDAGETDGKTYTVTVVSDSGNKYRFDGYGTSAVTLDLAEGGTYIFNYPSAHPFRFSTTSDGTHGGGSEYTTGVTVLSSTSVQIVVAASAPTLYYYCSIHSGMGGQVNTNSTLGSSNFDGSIQTTVKANASAGFSIMTYTGTGSAGTCGHGLGVVPDTIITKTRNATGNWTIYNKNLDNASSTSHRVIRLNTTAAQSGSSALYYGNDPTSTVQHQAAYTDLNGSGETYVAYCFSGVDGYSKFGKYTGNGNADGVFIFTGFRPAVIIIKSTSQSTPWNIVTADIDGYNVVTKYLDANSSSAESTYTFLDILSNGFKARNVGGSYNQSGGTYIYLAFAEAPFKNARAR